MKKWLMAVLLGTVLVLGACGGGGDTSEPADDGGGDSVDSSSAEAAYKTSCASCHGDALEGGVGPELGTIGSSMSVDEIEDIIVNGAGSMPGGLLSGDDVTEVSEWLADMK